MAEHSDTELVDIVAVRKTDSTVVWVEKEYARKDAQDAVTILTGRANPHRRNDRLYVLAPCGRWAAGDRYVAEVDG